MMKLFYNIRTRQLFIFFIIIVLNILLEIFIIIPLISNAIYIKEIKFQDQMTDALAGQFNYFFDSAADELKHISELNDIKTLDKKLIDKKISEYNITSQFFDYFFILDDKGKWISYPSRENFVGTNIPEQNMYWVNKVFKGYETVSIEVLKAKTEEFVTGIAVQINSFDKSKKALLRGVYVISKNNKILNQINNFKFAKNGYAYLVSKEGLLIAFKKSEYNEKISKINFKELLSVKNALEDKKNHTEYIFANNKFLATYRNIKSANCILILHQPKKDIIDEALLDSKIFFTIHLIIIFIIMSLMIISIDYPLKNFTNLFKIIKERKLLRKKSEKPKDQIQEIVAAINELFSELFNSKEELDKTLTKYKTLIETTSDAIWEIDIDFNYTYVSPRIKDILGYEPSEMLGKKPFDFMKKDEAEKNYKLFIDYANEKKTYINIKNINIHKDGYEVILETSAMPFFNNNNELIGYRGVDRDSSERYIYQQEIEKSLKEKEILLSEIHHRIKNNLLVITGIIELQITYLTDQNIIAILNDTVSRIKTISYIHQILYNTKDFIHINFKNFFITLIDSILYTFNIDKNKIQFNLDIENVDLVLSKIIPLGLIINEIITNSIKHAFPDNKIGIIDITFISEKNGFKLIVSDNGIGINHEINMDDFKSLGFKLINQLSKQLSANVKIQNDNGLKFIISFQ